MNRRHGLMAAITLACGLAAPGAFAQEQTLRFSWWGGGERHEATLKAIAAFEAKNPGVKIKAEYMGFQGYLERLTTQIAGGSEPDIMQINWAWLAMFSKTGDGFYDLNKSKSLLALNQFSDEELKMGTVRDKLNALPSSYTARIFLWNKASFDRAGLPDNGGFRPSTPELRLEDMDRDGVYSQVIYGPPGGIKLKDKANILVTTKDIVDNPKKLKFREIEAATLPRILPQVDLALINTNYALEAKLNPAKDALAIEGGESPYANWLVTRDDNQNAPAVKKLAAALQSDAVKRFIQTQYKGAVVPAF